MDRRFASEEEDNGPETGEPGNNEAINADRERARAEEQMKGLINTSLTGERLLASELYEKAASSGYYIATIHWTCQSDADSRVHIDCEAALVDPQEGEPFSFDFVRQWQYRVDGDEAAETVQVGSTQRRLYQNLIEAAARAALGSAITASALLGDRTESA